MPRLTNTADVDTLREEMDIQGNTLEAMKIAYLNGTPFRDTVPTIDDVRTAAQIYIRVHYAFQRARFGKVRVKLNVSDLLR